MEAFGFMLHLLVSALYVCNAAIIIDDKTGVLSSHDMDVENQYRKLPYTQISQTHPFSLNNLNNCNENAENEHLNSLSGRLLPTLLSVLSKSDSLSRTKDVRENGDNCELDQRSPNDRHNAHNKNKDSQPLSSRHNNKQSSVDSINTNLGGQYKATSKKHTRSQSPLTEGYVDDFDGNNFTEQNFKKSELSWNDDVSDLIRNMKKHDFKIPYSEGKGSFLNMNDNILSRNNAANNPGEKTSQHIGSLLDTNYNVLNDYNEEYSSNEQAKSTENVGSLVDPKIYVLNSDKEKNILDEQDKKIENEGSLIDNGLDILAKDNEENNTESITKIEGSLVKADVDVLNSDNEDNFPEEQTFENGDPLINVDVDILGSEKPILKDTESDVLGCLFPDAKDNTNNMVNSKTSVSNRKDKPERLEMNNNNFHIDDGKKGKVSNEGGFFYSPYNLERDYSSVNHPWIYTRTWPIPFNYQLLPEEHVIENMSLEKNVDHDNIQHLDPKTQYTSQRIIPSKRFFLPLGIFSQPRYPTIPQYPQSVAGSSLYGSSAKAEIIPGYGGAGGGVIDSSGTSAETSGTTIESSETSVENSETSEAG